MSHVSPPSVERAIQGDRIAFSPPAQTLPLAGSTCTTFPAPNPMSRTTCHCELSEVRRHTPPVGPMLDAKVAPQVVPLAKPSSDQTAVTSARLIPVSFSTHGC